MVGVLFGLTDYAYWLYVTDTEGNIDMSTTCHARLKLIEELAQKGI